MSFALSAAVTGLQAHQSMLDVAGNNLANVNSVAYKSSSVNFAELLSQTMKRASAPAGNLGGTNPQQKGTGVSLSNIAKNMTQGNILSTGQDLDMAIDGNGYFVVRSGDNQDYYTRVGAFSVDAENNLVDPATGYKVQRMGTTGEAAGFQSGSEIKVPYNVPMEASATSLVTLSGNLRTTAEATDASYHTMRADTGLLESGGDPASSSTALSALDWTGGGAPVAGDGAFVRISWVNDAGVAMGPRDINVDTTADTVGDLLSDIETDINAFANTDFTLSVDSQGRVVFTNNNSGYSQAQITNFTFNAGAAPRDGTITFPTFFDLVTPGGEDVKSFNFNIYDENGGEHTVAAAFVRDDTPANTWDMVVTSISGENARAFGDGYDRRIAGITFNNNGSFKEITDATTTISAAFGTMAQTFDFDFGSASKFDGLTQFAADQSTATALKQDGYSTGMLSSVSVDNSGLIVGTFTNGVRADIAMLKVAIFQNPAGLEGVGDGYFLTSSNSGTPIETGALSGGAGAIKGKSLEKSNVDTATEFVNLMQAQNGFQANARTIRVASDVLRELTNIVR